MIAYQECCHIRHLEDSSVRDIRALSSITAELIYKDINDGEDISKNERSGETLESRALAFLSESLSATSVEELKKVSSLKDF